MNCLKLSLHHNDCGLKQALLMLQEENNPCTSNPCTSNPCLHNPCSSNLHFHNRCRSNHSQCHSQYILHSNRLSYRRDPRWIQMSITSHKGDHSSRIHSLNVQRININPNLDQVL